MVRAHPPQYERLERQTERVDSRPPVARLGQDERVAHGPLRRGRHADVLVPVRWPPIDLVVDVPEGAAMSFRRRPSCSRCGYKVTVLSVGGMCEVCVKLDVSNARSEGRIIGHGHGSCGTHMGGVGSESTEGKNGRRRK